MIQNLNQVTFQGFGTVLPERAQPKQAAPKNAVHMKLTQMEASLYRANADGSPGAGSDDSRAHADGTDRERRAGA